MASFVANENPRSSVYTRNVGFICCSKHFIYRDNIIMMTVQKQPPRPTSRIELNQIKLCFATINHIKKQNYVLNLVSVCGIRN